MSKSRFKVSLHFQTNYTFVHFMSIRLTNFKHVFRLLFQRSTAHFPVLNAALVTPLVSVATVGDQPSLPSAPLYAWQTIRYSILTPLCNIDMLMIFLLPCTSSTALHTSLLIFRFLNNWQFYLTFFLVRLFVDIITWQNFTYYQQTKIWKKV